MARIADLLAGAPTASFEFFPPQTEDGDANLRRAINELQPLGADFVSVTYGAGGSTRERTHQIVVDLGERTSMSAMAHLTAVGHTRAELATILAHYRDAGVENIMALRGDPPRENPEAGWPDIQFASELVELAREVGGDQFSIGVAAHPYVHPLSPDRAHDRKWLAHKLEVADFAVTQFVFEVADWQGLVDDLADLGCTKPIVPGIMPITNVSSIRRMAELSGAAVPEWLSERLSAVEDDPAEVRRLGVELATQLCQDLLDAGAPGLHFYTLNRSQATREIHANLTWPDRS